MGREEAGDPLPNGRPQESAGNLAAYGKAQPAPPAAQWGTTDDWIPAENKSCEFIFALSFQAQETVKAEIIIIAL